MTHARVHLHLRDVRVRRGRRTVVDGVDLTVAPGGWTVLLGPNGAGKSSLLRAVVGLVGYRGSIGLDDVEVRSLGRRALARAVALVPQQPLIPDDMTVREYVLLGRTPHIAVLGTEREADHRAVDEVLDRLDLHPFAERRLGQLSGGEVQRAVLGRALAQEAPVLLLDEPTTSLDLGHVQQVLELVDELRHERSLTVLAAMHDLTLAAQYGDEVLVLESGRAVASGPPDEALQPELVSRVLGAHVHVGRDRSGGLVVVPSRRPAATRPAAVVVGAPAVPPVTTTPRSEP